MSLIKFIYHKFHILSKEIIYEKEGGSMKTHLPKNLLIIMNMKANLSFSIFLTINRFYFIFFAVDFITEI